MSSYSLSVYPLPSVSLLFLLDVTREHLLLVQQIKSTPLPFPTFVLFNNRHNPLLETLDTLLHLLLETLDIPRMKATVQIPVPSVSIIALWKYSPIAAILSVEIALLIIGNMPVLFVAHFPVPAAVNI